MKGIRSYPIEIRMLALCGFLNLGSQFLIVPLTSIYIHQQLGKSLTVAGIVLFLTSFGATVGQLLGGILFDKFGARPVLLWSFLTSTMIILIPALTEQWGLYVFSMIGFGLSTSLSMPTLNALAAKVDPQGGARSFNFLYVANNLGIAAGTAAGGFVAQYSFRLSFFISAIVVFSLFLFVFLFIHEKRPYFESSTEQAADFRNETHRMQGNFQVIPWRPILALCVGSIVLWIVYVQWQTTVSVHMQEIGIPLSRYSFLWTLNGLLIFLAQPLLGQIVKVFQSAFSQMFLGSLLYLLTFVMLTFANQFSIFIVGMIILTLGEMLLWPVIPATVSALSPPALTGFLQGVIGIAGSIGRMLGPLLGGVLYETYSFKVLVWFMICLLTVPFVCLLYYHFPVRQSPAKLDQEFRKQWS